MDGLTNGGGAQHHFIQPEPALSLSKNSAPNTVPALGKVAQDVMGFNFGTGVGRIGNDLGEEENLHW